MNADGNRNPTRPAITASLCTLLPCVGTCLAGSVFVIHKEVGWGGGLRVAFEYVGEVVSWACTGIAVGLCGSVSGWLYLPLLVLTWSAIYALTYVSLRCAEGIAQQHPIGWRLIGVGTAAVAYIPLIILATARLYAEIRGSIPPVGPWM